MTENFTYDSNPFLSGPFESMVLTRNFNVTSPSTHIRAILVSWNVSVLLFPLCNWVCHCLHRLVDSDVSLSLYFCFCAGMCLVGGGFTPLNMFEIAKKVGQKSIMLQEI